MYKINDKIIYKREVCVIKTIKEKLFNNKDYYCISPITDSSLTINVPTDSDAIRETLTKEEVLNIIEEIPNIEVINSDEKSLENVYKELLSTDDIKDLVKIIKTTYLRNQKRLATGKKIGDKDDTYFKKAEKLLYTNLSIALEMTYEECKEYVIKRITIKEGK